MAEKLPETINYTDIDIKMPSILDRSPNRYRKCSLIVTLADSQITIVEIQALLESGINVTKFRMSRTSKGEKLRLLGKIDKAMLACCNKYGVTNWPVATCIELKTCIVNTGALEDDNQYITLREQSEVFVNYDSTNTNKCNSKTIFVDDPYIIMDVKVGTDIFIGDEIILKCRTVIREKSLKCVVIKGGRMTNFNRVCARDINHSGPLLTKEDYRILKFALELQVDIILINYVRHPDTIRQIKNFIKSKKIKRPVLLSGICTEQCLANIDDIIKESDGVVMSREYLTYETNASNLYRLPHIQKFLAGKCLQAGKPLFISGGVFDVALNTGKFIDCEISDVTNALMDDVSGFLLKDCYDAASIVEVVNKMNKLCYNIEPFLTSKTKFLRIIDEVKLPVNAAEAAVISCATLANHSDAHMIVIPTVSGTTMKFLHWMRPCCLIITVSPRIRTMRLLRTYRSVMPLLYTGEQQNNWNQTVEARIFFAINYAVNRSWLLYGDTYVTLERGSESSSFCDTVRIWKVSISKKALIEFTRTAATRCSGCYNIRPNQAPAACKGLPGTIATMDKLTYNIEMTANMISADMNVAFLKLSFGQRRQGMKNQNWL